MGEATVRRELAIGGRGVAGTTGFAGLTDLDELDGIERAEGARVMPGTDGTEVLD